MSKDSVFFVFIQKPPPIGERCFLVPLFYGALMIVVYVADKNYMDFVNISAKSLLRHNPEAVIIVVSPEKVETEFENVVIPLSGTWKHRNNDRITSTTYLKLFLTQLPYDKIIYMDGDTLVLHPLDELWNMEPEYIALTESHDYGKIQAEDLGVEKYGLSGVMVMNLKNLRKIGFTQKCLQANPQVKHWCHEETLINVAMRGKLKFIPVKWNYCHDREYSDRSLLLKDVAILHICGKDKSYMTRNHYTEVARIKEYIKGKSVAIVGNAKSIFDHDFGKEIDKHDVVIRFNRGFITNEKAQGTKTDIVILACELTIDEKKKYKAFCTINRSRNTRCGDYTFADKERDRLKEFIGAQPSSGFMAIDLCRDSGAKSIDLYGFDFEKTKTFYNPDDYQTRHDYQTEEKIVTEMDKNGILTIN